VHKSAENQKVGFEQEGAVGIVKGMRLPKQSKEIEDPADWKELESTIRYHIEHGVKNISVNYTLTFLKTRRRVSTARIEEEEGSEDAENSPVVKKRKSNVSPHLFLLISAIDN
jgi:hypothetical protein